MTATNAAAPSPHTAAPVPERGPRGPEAPSSAKRWLERAMGIEGTSAQHDPSTGSGPSSPKRPQRAFGWSQLVQALPGALRRLNPATLLRNPVILLVWAGAALTTVLAIAEPFLGSGAAASGGTPVPNGFTWSIAVWLWLTVLFANLAESVAEGRGKAQAATLRKTRTSTLARRVVHYEAATDPSAEQAATEEVASSDLRRDDIVIVAAGEPIPGDGDIIAGIATVDESAITGESAPVVRESGGDRSAVTGGTRVLSDRIVVRITSKPGETFVDRMIALVEGADRQRTPTPPTRRPVPRGPRHPGRARRGGRQPSGRPGLPAPGARWSRCRHSPAGGAGRGAGSRRGARSDRRARPSSARAPRGSPPARSRGS
ncbi:hypothetical protein JCM13591A_02680 [Microbacterium xylanilyticum]